MAAITASAVNELRQATGCGLMDCKKALVENEGDFEKALFICVKRVWLPRPRRRPASPPRAWRTPRSSTVSA